MFCFPVDYKDNVGPDVWSLIPSSKGLLREIEMAMLR